eukprot:TRINITY_DN4987_c0_g1_i1.p1 TRINITY_DN4987_c0_g1~~TRINITY_DN4987_c0_g1_i1.p1  ORF type:complete len:1811 (-),score=370.81 TRINITY_DN4987_c0_g1_i1:86-5518(-)
MKYFEILLLFFVSFNTIQVVDAQANRTNDKCTTAYRVVNEGNFTFNTTGANYAYVSCSMRTVWFDWRNILTCNGIRFRVCDAPGNASNKSIVVYGNCSTNTVIEATTCFTLTNKTCTNYIQLPLTQDILGLRIAAASDGTAEAILQAECIEPPSNDLCANSIPISDSVIQLSTVNATTDGIAGCTYYRDVWYKYNSTCDGGLLLATDAKYSFYPSSLCSFIKSGFRQTFCTYPILPVSKSRNYLIRFGSSTLSTGYDATANFTCIPGSINNSVCENATVINGEGNFQAPIFGAPQGDCEYDAYYTWTATCNGVFEVSACNNAVETVVSIVNCSSSTFVGTTRCAYTPANFSCGYGNHTKRVEVKIGDVVNFTVGSSYYVFDPVNFTVKCTPSNLVPSNIRCDTPKLVNDGQTMIDTSHVPDFYSNPYSCAAYRGLWFSYNATCSGTLSVNILNISDHEFTSPSIGLYIASNACNNNYESCLSYSYMHQPVDLGQQLVISFGGNAYYQAMPDITGILDIRCYSRATNDDCSGVKAINFPSGGGSVSVSTLGANDNYYTDTSNRCDILNTIDAFYSFKSNCYPKLTSVSTCDVNSDGVSRNFIIERTGTCPVSYDYLYTYYDSCSTYSATCSPLYSDIVTILLDPTVDTLLVLFVEDTPVSTNVTNINFKCVDPIPNDNCSTPVVIPPTGVEVPFDNRYGTRDHSVYEDGYIVNRDLWYSYVADCTGTLRVNLPSPLPDGLRAQVFFDVSPNDNTIRFNCSNYWPAHMGYNEVSVVIGEKYYLRVGNYYYDRSYIFNFSVTCIPGRTNDECIGALDVVGEGSFDFNLTDAVSTGCGSYSDVWFAWNATCSGVAVISSCAQYSLITMTDECGNYTYVLDKCRSGCSQVLQSVVKDEDYYISISSFENSGTFTIQCSPSSAPNDECKNAQPIIDGTYSFNGTSLSREPVGNTCNSHDYGDVWYNYTASCTGLLSVTSTTALFYTTTSCSEVRTNPNVVNCYLSYYPVVVGSSYLVQVSSDAGNTDVTFTCTPYPMNDECIAANVLTPQQIAAGYTNFDISSSTPSTLNVSTCNDNYVDVWYDYLSPCDGTLSIKICPQYNNYARLSVFENCFANSQREACTYTYFCDSYYFTSINTYVTNGTHYKIVVGTEYQFSKGQLYFDCSPSPPGDHCKNAIPIPANASSSVAFQTYNFTDEIIKVNKAVSCIEVDVKRDIWFSYVAPCTGYLTVAGTYTDTRYDSNQDVFFVDGNFFINLPDGCGSSISPAGCISGNTDYSMRGEVNVTYGDVVTIRLGASYHLSIDGTFSITCSPVFVNDECNNPATLLDGLNSLDGRLATLSTFPAHNASVINDADTFYQYIATCPGLMNLTFLNYSTAKEVNYVKPAIEVFDLASGCTQPSTIASSVIYENNTSVLWETAFNGRYLIRFGANTTTLSGYFGRINIACLYNKTLDRNNSAILGNTNEGNTQVEIGVGVGVGVPLVLVVIALIVVALLFFRNRYQRLSEELPDEVAWQWRKYEEDPTTWEEIQDGVYCKNLKNGSEEWLKMEELISQLDSTDIKIKSATAVYNRNLLGNFVNRRALNDSRYQRSRETFYAQDWKKKKEELRSWVWEEYEKKVKSFSWNLGVPTELAILPVVHGTDKFIADKIAETGFAALSKLDAGWYGKGIYFTTSTLYSVPYFATKKTPSVIVSMVVPGNVYPVIENHKEENSLEGQGMKGGYSSNYVVTKRDGIPPKKPVKKHYDELVVDQEVQIVPLYILSIDSANLPELIKKYQRETTPGTGGDEDNNRPIITNEKDGDGSILTDDEEEMDDM